MEYGKKAYLNTDEPANDAKVIAFNGRRFGAKTLLKEMTRCLHPHLETFYIYSLSKRPNNKHLWMSYAAGHTGYCLEFRTEGTLERVFEVRYTDFAIDITDPDQTQGSSFSITRNPGARKKRFGSSRIEPPIQSHILSRTYTRAILGSKIEPGNAAQMREWAANRDPPLIVVSETEIGRPSG